MGKQEKEREECECSFGNAKFASICVHFNYSNCASCSLVSTCQIIKIETDVLCEKIVSCKKIGQIDILKSEDTNKTGEAGCTGFACLVWECPPTAQFHPIPPPIFYMVKYISGPTTPNPDQTTVPSDLDEKNENWWYMILIIFFPIFGCIFYRLKRRGNSNEMLPILRQREGGDFEMNIRLSDLSQ